MTPSKIKSGTMVVIRSLLDRPIYARRRPESLRGPRSKALEDLVVTTIPEGSRALYMGAQEDTFNTALRTKGRGPYGYTPTNVYYYFVLWEGRPVWVSSSEADLEVINEVSGL